MLGGLMGVGRGLGKGILQNVRENPKTNALAALTGFGYGVSNALEGMDQAGAEGGPVRVEVGDEIFQKINSQIEELQQREGRRLTFSEMKDIMINSGMSEEQASNIIEKMAVNRANRMRR